MIIDSRGRIFGRVNLFDALVLAFFLALLPTAYATYLLFRPASPQIATVDSVEITREERRLAGGSRISAKLKVRGSGFNPMLRAAIDATPAIGFVFENPNSADVIVGDLAPGTYDLVLLDGVQEVARAADAVTIAAGPGHQIRAIGYVVDLTAETASNVHVGDAYPADSPRAREIALGSPRPGRTRVRVGNSVADREIANRLERPAVISLTCDPYPADEPCAVGGVAVTGDRPVVTLAGPQQLRFVIAEVLPDAAPRRAIARVRLTGGPELQRIAVGDRDASLDERAAIVAEVRTQGSNAGSTWADVAIEFGLDESREGWRYRGELVRPGSLLSLELPGALVRGTVESVTLKSDEEEPR